MDLIGAYRSARRDPGLVVLEGFHAVKHALRFGAEVVRLVAPDPAAVAGLASDLAPDLVAALDERIEPVSMDVFEALAPRPHPTGLIGLAARPPATDVLAASGRLVVLERPKRPNNVGAAVRVAAAAGAAGLLVIDGVDPWSPEAVRTGAGLQFAIAVGSSPRLDPTDRPIIVFAAGGDPDPALPADAIVCFGSERSGISAGLAGRATATRSLPMREGVSSLNLATAVAAALYRSGP